jgi:hemerythrin superfamily protein
MEIANYQETIRYYDIKEFKEEQRTKELLVELKNSETRMRAIQKLNFSYKQIIDQLLHDALYYKPVLDALNGDWNEQTAIVKKTYDIGFPAIQNVKKLDKELKSLRSIVKKEDNERFDEITKNRNILKEQPKFVKTLVRHDVSEDGYLATVLSFSLFSLILVCWGHTTIVTRHR